MKKRNSTRGISAAPTKFSAVTLEEMGFGGAHQIFAIERILADAKCKMPPRLPHFFGRKISNMLAFSASIFLGTTLFCDLAIYMESVPGSWDALFKLV